MTCLNGGSWLSRIIYCYCSIHGINFCEALPDLCGSRIYFITVPTLLMLCFIWIIMCFIFLIIICVKLVLSKYPKHVGNMWYANKDSNNQLFLINLVTGWAHCLEAFWKQWPNKFLAIDLKREMIINFDWRHLLKNNISIFI